METNFNEKIEFLKENKCALIENIGIVGYELFSVLNSEESLNEMESYKKILEIISNKTNSTNYYSKDEAYILYYLSNFLDRINMDIIEKEKSRANLFKYISYFNKKNIQNNSNILLLRKNA